MKHNANILFISGVGVGKTETIETLWGKKDVNGIYEVSDEIPGRGIMNFEAIEMSPVLYSFKNFSNEGNWFNEDNTKYLSKADTIVYLLPAKSYGYDREIQFIVEMFSGVIPHIKNIPFVIGITQIEKLKDKEQRSYKNVITSVLDIERYICSLFSRYGLERILSIENIVPFSASKDINLYKLKEKIWDGVISHTNNNKFDETKPTIVVSGKRGCGKSSTLNALFGLTLPVDCAVACTKYPRVMKGTLQYNSKKMEVNIVDLPGIAESIKADMTYYPFYKKYVECANVLLCINQANVRAYKQDEVFYKHLSESETLKPSTSIIIAMNHSDSLFKDFEHLDGVELTDSTEAHPMLNEKIEDMFEANYKHFFVYTHSELSRDCVVPISAYQNWNIDKLKNLIISKIIKHG